VNAPLLSKRDLCGRGILPRGDPGEQVDERTVRLASLRVREARLRVAGRRSRKSSFRRSSRSASAESVRIPRCDLLARLELNITL